MVFPISVCVMTELSIVRQWKSIQKTLGNSINNSKRQIKAIKNITSAVSGSVKGDSTADTKTNSALEALDAAIYGDRSELKARADAALTAFEG